MATPVPVLAAAAKTMMAVSATSTARGAVMAKHAVSPSATTEGAALTATAVLCAVTAMAEPSALTATEGLVAMPAPTEGMMAVVAAVTAMTVTAMAEVMSRATTAVMTTTGSVMVSETAMRTAEAMSAAMGVSLPAAVSAGPVMAEAVTPSTLGMAAPATLVFVMAESVAPTVRVSALGGTALATLTLAAEARMAMSVAACLRAPVAVMGRALAGTFLVARCATLLMSARLRAPVAAATRTAPGRSAARRTCWTAPLLRLRGGRTLRGTLGTIAATEAETGTKTWTAAAPPRSLAPIGRRASGAIAVSGCGRGRTGVPAVISPTAWRRRRTATPIISTVAIVFRLGLVLVPGILPPLANITTAPAVPVGEAAESARAIALEAGGTWTARARLIRSQAGGQEHRCSDPDNNTQPAHPFLPWLKPAR
jgi:hypothetical protein